MRRLKTLLQFAAPFAALALLTALLLRLSANAATAGFGYVLLILGSSVIGGKWSGFTGAVAATLVYNYFFLPPLHTFFIAATDDWVALIAFLTTSIVTSSLVTRAREQAVERERLTAESAHVDALKEANELKTSILRAVSHDLTTPLTSLTLQIERLRPRVSDDAVPAVDQLARDTARLRRRIENLLAIARVEARTTIARPEPTPAADLFRAAQEHLPLDDRPLEIRVDVDCPDLFVDPSLALEILVNVIENAHHASPAGVPIELTARGGVGTVRIEIADRGRGIRDNEPSDTARRGLGLEIARALTMTSGGDLLLTRREGGGTIARLTLPAAHLPNVEPEVTA